MRSTGLPNRKLFMQRLDHALELARQRDEQVAVAFVDLDGFKAVERHPRPRGRRSPAARQSAERLGETLRGSGLFVARVGGREQVCAILTGVADRAAAR